jgi:flagellar M-ring protein FliF
VEQGTADTVRMQLAVDGLPQGNLPYDLNTSGGNFAETEKDKQIRNLQQTQNRLQDTIKTIPGVTQAIVNIAQSTDDTYVLETDKSPTTASVKLTLKDGTELTKAQVNGIAAVVATGVSGLTADNVTIADNNGSVLNGDVTNTDETTEQFKIKSQIESGMKSKISDMLSMVYGKNNYNVVVNADMDFSSRSTQTSSFTSGVPVYVSEASKVEVNGSTPATGTAGVSGTQPTTTYPNVSAGTGTYTSSYSRTTSMFVGNYIEQAKQIGGKLNKVSVSLILNSYNSAAASTDIAALKQNIADAVGTTTDNISIGVMAFSSLTPTASSTPAGGSTIPLLNIGTNMLYIIVAGILLLIVLLALFLVLTKQHKKKREEKAQLALAAAQAEEALKNPSSQPRPPATPVKSIEETLAEAQVNSLKKEIEDFTDKKPDLVAQILKNWLKD